MKQSLTSKSLLVLAVAVLFVVGAPLPVAADDDDRPSRVAGAYRAELDLGALGAPRIEILYVIMGLEGSVLFTSEHEADKESAGVGIWRRVSGGGIFLGAASFRYGPDPATSACAGVGVTSPPGNCVLKVGGTVERQGDGSYAGNLFLSIETTDASSVIEVPAPLPITMERLTPGDFPGAP